MLTKISRMPSLIKSVVAALATLALLACEPAPREEERTAPEPEESRPATPTVNPLLDRYLTPFRTPPFHRLDADHFLPALEQAIEEHREAVAAIVDDDGPARFSNTIEALEHAENDLQRIIRTLNGLIAVSADVELHQIAPEFSAQAAAYRDTVLFNEALFERIESVHDRIEDLSLEPEKHRLVELTYRRFVHAGAKLPEPEQQRLRKINKLLAELAGNLDLRLREATRDFELLIEDETLLDGLPESLINLATRTARDRGHTTGWAFTLHEYSLRSFLTQFPERKQRQAMYEAWIQRLEPDNTQDDATAGIIQKMAEKRAERAELLGFDSHLDYELAGSNIGDRERLRELIDTVASAAHDRITEELEQLEALARADGLDGELEPWDWWYFNERLRETELDQTDAGLRDWFSLEQVRDGAFALANRLWGLSFHVRTDVPLWDSDIDAYEVRDAMGEHLGVIYLDYRHRASKRAGAWTTVYRPPHHHDGERIAPVVANVTNFPPPAAGLPSLLPPEEVQTLFRQFGNAMSELLADVPYSSLAISTASADFAEFPARLLQHWALQPEVLRMYAYHHETGSMITDEAIDALAADQRLLAGIKTMQQIAAIQVDLVLHEASSGNVPTLQTVIEKVRQELDLPNLVSPHQYAQGLGSLYVTRHEGTSYQTLWAQMLAADAFAAFEQATILDRNISATLREDILGRGNSRPPMESWQAFRGRNPEARYFLKARGLAD